jgi:diaminopimelate epimerase
MEHWDVDGGATFCSNGTRAALGVPGAPEGAIVEVFSNGQPVQLRRQAGGVGLRLPEGEGFGLKPLPAVGLDPAHAAFGFVGNPQLVLRVPSVEGVDLPTLAPPLRFHTAIPGGTNVNVVEVLAPGHARIRSWERGVEGETLCCGTGCSVTAAWLATTEGETTWRLETASGDPVTVSLAWAAPGRWRDLWLSGPIRALGTLELGAAFAHL